MVRDGGSQGASWSCICAWRKMYELRHQLYDTAKLAVRVELGKNYNTQNYLDDSQLGYFWTINFVLSHSDSIQFSLGLILPIFYWWATATPDLIVFKVQGSLRYYSAAALPCQSPIWSSVQSHTKYSKEGYSGPVIAPYETNCFDRDWSVPVYRDRCDIRLVIQQSARRKDWNSL